MAKNCMLGDNFDNGMIGKLEESVITFVNWNTRDSTKKVKQTRIFLWFKKNPNNSHGKGIIIVCKIISMEKVLHL